ncbi:hypothetical protein H9P43_009470 [Blastocladiella emersonii ATCC 22665]|nr:hypothetical protein H9P43_009470 [Blastocladiella emersonii ATCC 22665]
MVHAVTEVWSPKVFLRERETFRNSVAGAAAGAGASFLTCPLDVVKTRLQNSSPPRYRGTVDGLVTILRTEGYRGWYRGLSATMLGYLPSWAIYFTAYEEAKRALYRIADPPSFGEPSPHPWMTPGVINILSAMSAGVVSTSATNPLWVVKSRLMTQSETTAYRYTSIADAFTQILRKEGLRGFYKGLGTSLLGVTHAAVQFPLYEKLKFAFHTGSLSTPRQPLNHHREAVAMHHILAASVMSKMFASMITYPHEVIRTRLQNQTDPAKYNGLRHCVTRIAQEEGYRAFYRGLGTNLFRTLPASAITLFTYERLARALDEWVAE